MIDIFPHEGVRCKGIENLRFSNVHAIALNYPLFRGRESMPLGNIYFYNSSFTVVDEIDGERCARPELIREHAENLHLINTELLRK
jgi:hypothetical protein